MKFSLPYIFKIDSEESEPCDDTRNCNYAVEHNSIVESDFSPDYWKFSAIIGEGNTGSDDDDCKNIARHLGIITPAKIGDKS